MLMNIYWHRKMLDRFLSLIQLPIGYYIESHFLANINTQTCNRYICREKCLCKKHAQIQHWLFLVGRIMEDFYFSFGFVCIISYNEQYHVFKKEASINQKVHQSIFLNNRIIYLGARLHLSLDVIAPSKGHNDLNEGGSHQRTHIFLLRFLSTGEPHNLV